MWQAGSMMGFLGLDTGPYSRGMLQVTSIAQMFPQTVTAFLANPLLGFASLAGSVFSAVTSGVRSMISEFGHVVDEMDNVRDAAASVGVSVEEISSLGEVAKMNGSSVEELADAYKFLGKNAAEAASGNKEAMASFLQLGISATDVKNGVKNLPTLFDQVADGMSKASAGGQRTKIAMELLGRGGLGVIQMLQDGSRAMREQQAEVIRLGGAIDTHAANSADAWNDALAKVSVMWDGIKRSFFVPILDALLPQLEELVNWMGSHSSTVRDWVSQIGAEAGRWIADTWRKLKEYLPTLDEIKRFVTEIWRLAVAAADKIDFINKSKFTLEFEEKRRANLEAQRQALFSKPPVSITVNAQPIPTDATTTEIANKLKPAIQEANKKLVDGMSRDERTYRVIDGM